MTSRTESPPNCRTAGHAPERTAAPPRAPACRGGGVATQALAPPAAGFAITRHSNLNGVHVAFHALPGPPATLEATVGRILEMCACWHGQGVPSAEGNQPAIGDQVQVKLGCVTPLVCLICSLGLARKIERTQSTDKVRSWNLVLVLSLAPG